MNDQTKTSIADAKQQWEDATVAASLKKAPEHKETFVTSSGIELERLYTPDDSVTSDNTPYQAQLGFPGEFPFTRGVQPTMYRSRFWTMRQYAGYATAEESNARYRFLLANGQTGLSVAFDLPTQIGYDADDPISHGEVGKVGSRSPRSTTWKRSSRTSRSIRFPPR